MQSLRGAFLLRLHVLALSPLLAYRAYQTPYDFHKRCSSQYGRRTVTETFRKRDCCRIGTIEFFQNIRLQLAVENPVQQIPQKELRTQLMQQIGEPVDDLTLEHVLPDGSRQLAHTFLAKKGCRNAKPLQKFAPGLHFGACPSISSGWRHRSQASKTSESCHLDCEERAVNADVLKLKVAQGQRKGEAARLSSARGKGSKPGRSAANSRSSRKGAARLRGTRTAGRAGW